jgi:hypothetical protein
MRTYWKMNCYKSQSTAEGGRKSEAISLSFTSESRFGVSKILIEKLVSSKNLCLWERQIILGVRT